MQKDDKITFYHVATNTQDLKSFFHEDAKSVLPNSNNKGLYVWSNEKEADDHIRLLEAGLLNKTLNNHEALIFGVQLSKKDLTYPTWQLDVECAPGLLELFKKHSSTINQNLDNLSIELPPNNSFLTKISKISCQIKEGGTDFIFKGKTSVNTDLSFSLRCRDNSNPCQGQSDAVYLNALVGALSTHNDEFKKDYNQLMQDMCQFRGPFKYTGSKNLPVSFIKHAQITENNEIKKTVLFDTSKGTQQVCPFFKIKNIQR